MSYGRAIGEHFTNQIIKALVAVAVIAGAIGFAVGALT